VSPFCPQGCPRVFSPASRKGPGLLQLAGFAWHSLHLTVGAGFHRRWRLSLLLWPLYGAGILALRLTASPLRHLHLFSQKYRLPAPELRESGFRSGTLGLDAVSEPASQDRTLRTRARSFVGSRSRLAMARQVLSSPRRAAYARACAARCGVLEAGALHAGALLAGGAGCSLQFNVSGPVAPARWTCSPCWQPSLTGHDPPSPVSSASRRVHAGLCCPPRNPCSPTRSPGALHAGAPHAGGAPAVVMAREPAFRARMPNLRTSSSCWQPGLAPQVTGRLASSSPRRTVC
jgi:hypothetical protein